MSELTPSPYGDLLAKVKQYVRAAQDEALRAVNQQLIGLYWDIRAGREAAGGCGAVMNLERYPELRWNR